MHVEHNSRVLWAHHNVQPPAKQITPTSAKKSVSAAAIFKQPRQALKDDHTKRQKPPSRLVAQHASDGKARSIKSGSSSRSPPKAGSRVSKKTSGLHPLAVAFGDTSDDYRRHLYKSTTLKINNTLEALVNSLYDNSLQTISSDPTDQQGSPIRLTIPAKFERAALKLYQPISAYKIGLTRTNTDGTQIKFPATLESRMTDYADLIASQKAEIQTLKDKWETIVGEIWKVGVQCLGEQAMESMLFTNKRDVGEVESSPEKAESTLFVTEQVTSPPRRTTRGKKRVTFVEAVNDMEDPPRPDDGPLYFLHQPTRLRVGPVPAGPALPIQEMGRLETRIQELGQKEYEELNKAERDYKLYWQKKNERLAQVFGED